MRALVPRLTVPPVSFFELEREHPLGVRLRERPLARACATLTLAPPPIATVPRLEQAGHEIIMQVEGDERCAAVLREQFPRARSTAIFPVSSSFPPKRRCSRRRCLGLRSGDEDAKERSGWRSLGVRPRAAALEEHEHFFRLLATRPVAWVLVELPVSLLRWATAAVPGARGRAIFSPPSPRPRHVPLSTSLSATATRACQLFATATMPFIPPRCLAFVLPPRDHSPDPPPHALDRDPSLSSARPPPIANVVKRLETLGYRWAYRVVNLPGASPRDGNDRIGYRIGHRAF